MIPILKEKAVVFFLSVIVSTLASFCRIKQFTSKYYHKSASFIDKQKFIRYQNHQDIIDETHGIGLFNVTLGDKDLCKAHLVQNTCMVDSDCDYYQEHPTVQPADDNDISTDDFALKSSFSN